jgi:pyruvate/2-oxoglutarate dehydrogenase complex dihydrolipoamide dehydrogenase (E3) component
MKLPLQSRRASVRPERVSAVRFRVGWSVFVPRSAVPPTRVDIAGLEERRYPPHTFTYHVPRIILMSFDVSPLDEHNKELLANVHPEDWQNPEPADKYNLVVIGGGTAGLITSIVTASMGGKAALIEKNLMGGDCLNVGCVPSKAIIRSARFRSDILRAQELGWKPVGDAEVDFAAVMERMRRIRTRISADDSAARYRDEGVDVFIGEGRFIDSNTVEVDGKRLKFKKAVIATGARAVCPPIPGIDEAGYLTNETVFNLTELPRRLAVIGGGPIGCELAQAFQRFGSQVTIMEMMPQFLIREDPEAAEILRRALEREGLRIALKAAIEKIEKTADGKRIHYTVDGKSEIVDVDEILVGAGRAPNVQGLGLEAVGVEYDERTGVTVDDGLRTTNKNIYAAGDICSPYKFTHTADAAAQIVIGNALFKGRRKFSKLVIPWATYTDPEIAHVGMYEADAKTQGIEIDTYMAPFGDVHRAIAEGEEEGFVKIHVKKGTDTIVGATVVASHAGEMISEITTCMVHGIGLGKIASVIHPYPTQSEAIKKCAGLYRRRKLTPRVAGIIKKWLAFSR